MRSRFEREREPEAAILSRGRKMEVAATARELMIEGYDDDDIADQLSLTPEQYEVVKKYLLTTLGDAEETKAPKERFAQYVIDTQRDISDINAVISNLNDKRQYSSVLAAIRLRGELRDKIITTGQTLGVIAKEPDRKVIIGGIAVTDLDDRTLRRGVVKAIVGLQGLLERYGGDGGANLRNVSPGPLHYGDAVVEDAPIDTTGETVAKTEPEPDQLILQVPAATPALGKPGMSGPVDNRNNRANSVKRIAGRKRARGGHGSD